MSIDALSMNEALSSFMDTTEPVSEAYRIAERVTECQGCGIDDDMDGRIGVQVQNGNEYNIACRLLTKECRYGNMLMRRMNQYAIDSAMAVPGVPMRFKAAMQNPQKTHATKGVIRWSKNGFLLLYGEHGTGKSFAAVYALYLLALESLEKNWKYPSAWSAINATWTSAYRLTTKDDIFEASRISPVLVIDDLGSEQDAGWAKAKIVETTSERYNQRKLTIITTNYDSTQIEGVYGKRMSDRVLGDGLSVYCGGESLRLTLT